MDNFFMTTAFPWVEGQEDATGKGVLSLDPNDPGNWTGGRPGLGELHGTKWGVSAAAYPNVDISALTYSDAAALAEKRYWIPAGCPQLPEPVALCVFDFAYNAGPHEAVKVLQRSVGVAPDGAFGPQTLNAVLAKDPQQVVLAFHDARDVAYQQMGGFNRYGRGWEARDDATRDKALSLIPS